MRLCNLIIMSLIFGPVGAAIAEGQSELQARLHEDLTDPYHKFIVGACGTTEELTIEFKGKLDHNPRENDGDGFAVSTMATSALEGLQHACTNNKVVASKMHKLTSIIVTRGKGQLGYSYSGGNTITLTFDTAKSKDGPADQRDKLSEKIRGDLDR